MNKYFKEAMKEAEKAYKKNEVPVGAVVVKDHKIIAKAHNDREHKNNVLGHAEIIAITKAAKKLKTWKLNNCDIYVTLKPCGMCEKIIIESRINNVYYILDKLSFKKEYNKTKFVQTNVCANYEKILNQFFKNKR